MTTEGGATGTATFRDGLAASRSGNRRAVFNIALQQVFYGLIPFVVTVSLLRIVLWSKHNVIAVDFHNAYWVAADRLIHGGDPYAWTRYDIHTGIAFVYPALSAVVFVPFALLSQGAAGVLFTFICIACVPLTLWILDVRDWRVYGISMIWYPVFDSWQTGNESIVLAVLVALVWRYRNTPLAAGLLTAVAMSMKPVIWPLAIWLIVTRRWRASAYGLAIGLVLNVVCWSLVGFDKISVYLRDSGIDTHHAWRAGYSVAAALGHLGFSRSVGDGVTLAVCLALAVAIVYVAFVKRRERQALTLTIILMLAASPLLWSHYFTLLFIPLALARPRMSWLWALPVLTWGCPPSWHVHAWQETVTWLVIGTLLVVVTRAARE